MRKAFVTALTELADADPRVLLLTGDLGFMAVEPFAERHPDRFINVGVAGLGAAAVGAGWGAELRSATPAETQDLIGDAR